MNRRERELAAIHQAGRAGGERRALFEAARGYRRPGYSVGE
jgi:hypothetical protein